MISYPWEAEVGANIAGLLHVWHESEWAVLKPAPFIFPRSDWPNFCPGAHEQGWTVTCSGVLSLGALPRCYGNAEITL